MMKNSRASSFKRDSKMQQLLLDDENLANKVDQILNNSNRPIKN